MKQPKEKAIELVNRLAIQLDMDEEFCHIGMMNVEQCDKVVEVCKPFLPCA